MTTLRPYQAAALDAVRARFAAGDRATLVELPTGCGKTVLFAELARQVVAQGGRVLIVAHRAELLEQACAKVQSLGVPAAIEQGPARAGDAPVVVASVATMRGARLASWPATAFGLVVVDEAHHAPAAGYRAILARFVRARVLGVTATPDRLDGAGLGEVFASCAYRYGLRDAIRDGWLARLVARRVRLVGVDLGAVRTRGGDLEPQALAAAVAAEAALHGVAGPLLELAAGRRTVLFAVDRAHARALVEVLNRRQDGAARSIDGTTCAGERLATLAAFRAGAFPILVNVALLTEGWDEPTVDCVAIARPTKSRALYAQMLGRGTRLAPGKADCLLLDFTGQAGRHRLAGPDDALAGSGLDAATRAALDDLLTADARDLDAALVEAAERGATAARTIAADAVARYRAEAIDPFVDLPPVATLAGAPATDAQRAALERAGLKRLPPALGRDEAHRWLVALERRRARGLASLPQFRLLSRWGVDARHLTSGEAGALIEASRNNGWRGPYSSHGTTPRGTPAMPPGVLGRARA